MKEMFFAQIENFLRTAESERLLMVRPTTTTNILNLSFFTREIKKGWKRCAASATLTERSKNTSLKLFFGASFVVFPLLVVIYFIPMKVVSIN